MSKIKVQYRPKKRFGQNFLIDLNVSDKIINSCRLTNNDIVVEVGPGLGVITQEISRRVRRLIAVEIDKDLCQILSTALSGRKNIEVVCTDFLKTDLSEIYNKYILTTDNRILSRPDVELVAGSRQSINIKAGHADTRRLNFQRNLRPSAFDGRESALKKDSNKLKIIGNLPFYITSPIISYIIENRQVVNSVFITVQKEVADRITASPGKKEFGSFSCFVQFYTKPKVLFDIKKACFWPRPEVDASFLELEMLDKPSVKVHDEELLFKIIRAAFNQRRKNIPNSLKTDIAKTDLQNALKDLRINPNSRAEDLSLSDFASIADKLQD